jgi:hypothetical protein
VVGFSNIEIKVVGSSKKPLILGYYEPGSVVSQPIK